MWVGAFHKVAASRAAVAISAWIVSKVPQLLTLDY
jgi:hypothetical protein